MRSHKPRKKADVAKKIGEKRCPKDSLIQNGAIPVSPDRVFWPKLPRRAFLAASIEGAGVTRTGNRIHYSWPLNERSHHFELGSLLDCAADFDRAGLRGRSAGWWECELADNALSWSGGVYDLFEIPRGTVVSRDVALARYAEGSRSILDRLRAEAVRSRSGFTLDAELALPAGPRWIRIIAAPDIVNGQAVRLHGLKVAL
jgi:hypothetical protein